MYSHQFDPNLVRPLAAAESQFLQVLVDRFSIRRKGNGFELACTFTDKSPAIWLRAAKRHILSHLPKDRREAVQRQIDAFFASGSEVYEYYDPAFPFRLGNGGTLPVVRLNGTDYYCLFYRDSHPTGWNIANGGANTRYDLLHPDAIVERELREELVIVEPDRGLRYVFDWHDARLRDHPDFAVANEHWAAHFRRQGYPKLKDVDLPLKWSLPPDADLPAVEERHHDAMGIRCGDEVIHTGRGFLNLNAEDFGIEFDRIAKLSVGPDAIFCDGELRGAGLLNRVIGLFAVNGVQEAVKHGEHHFRPARLYWDGECCAKEEPEDVIAGFLKRRGSSWAQLEETLGKNATPNPPGDPLDLCPVTRTIIGRHRQLRAPEPGAPLPLAARVPFEVFVSFASEDQTLAQKVYAQLAASHNVFFSDVTMTGGAFADQIDRALDSAWAFVAVGSRTEHLCKSWVKYEWRNFHNDMMSGRKPADSPFFAFVAGIDPQDLPRPLRLQQAIIADLGDPTPAMARLSQFVSKP